ncbi:SOH1 family protein, variant 2 [Coprinopsis cinerea AmutBmut pab1-1]|nr:SOH1 family protein, variant 2 [Coprinopsis cinerea AmutBmut pab1-1]
MSAHPGQTPGVSAPTDPKSANRARFELELEFVQALANPYYLHSLAQQNILEKPAFVNYLKYLLYWKDKDYARFIHYPHALHHLELLQNAQFRAALKKDEFLRDYLQQKQFDHWRTWCVAYRFVPRLQLPFRASNLDLLSRQARSKAP